MLKINNKNRTRLGVVLVSLLLIWTYFTNCSRVSIVTFEKINAGLVDGHRHLNLILANNFRFFNFNKLEKIKFVSVIMLTPYMVFVKSHAEAKCWFSPQFNFTTKIFQKGAKYGQLMLGTYNLSGSFFFSQSLQHLTLLLVFSGKFICSSAFRT